MDRTVAWVIADGRLYFGSKGPTASATVRQLVDFDTAGVLCREVIKSMECRLGPPHRSEDVLSRSRSRPSEWDESQPRSLMVDLSKALGTVDGFVSIYTAEP